VHIPVEFEIFNALHYTIRWKMKRNTSLNRTDASLFLGVSVRTIHNIVLRGQLRQMPDGRFAKKDLDDYLKTKKRNDTSLKSLLELQIKQTKAKREELLLKQLTGEVVPIKSVYAVWGGRLSEVVAALWALPNSLPPILEGKNEQEIRDIINQEMKLILQRHARNGKWTPTG
jgi:hypothetical protein